MNVTSAGLSFAAGFLSFFTPCVLPIMPTYLLYVAGASFEEDGLAPIRLSANTILHSASFILGFSAVFITLGAASTLAGRLLFHYRGMVLAVGGALIMLFGLQMTGLIKWLPEGRVSMPAFFRKSGALGAFIMGVTFSLVWTPCSGPVLGSILVLAAASDTLLQGILLLVLYSLGLALPFMMMSLFVNHALGLIKGLQQHMRVVSLISGMFVFAIGLLIATNNFRLFSRLFPR